MANRECHCGAKSSDIDDSRGAKALRAFACLEFDYTTLDNAKLVRGSDGRGLWAMGSHGGDLPMRAILTQF